MWESGNIIFQCAQEEDDELGIDEYIYRCCRNLSFCLPDTFFLLLCRKYTQSFCQDKNPKNQPVITTNSISKISGRPVNAPSGLDVVPLVLRIYEIRRQIVPPSTHIHPIYKRDTKQPHSHSSTHTYTCT